MMKKILSSILALAAIASCSDYMEPLPDGTYTEDNLFDYPLLVRGLIYKLYEFQSTGYDNPEYLGIEAASDNLCYRDKTKGFSLFATGSPNMRDYPFSYIWSRDYSAIMYAGKFLEDNKGINTRMIIGEKSDSLLRHTLQGDAYGMRAWYLADLLTKFGGVGLDGKLYGVPFYPKPLKANEYAAENKRVKRYSYDETVAFILKDCDSAMLYLPLANRDFVREPEMVPVTGSYRYGMIDQVSINCLRALTYLTWASPAFNPQNDLSRWEKAAEYAKEVIDYKLNVEGKVVNGFDPMAKIGWCIPNSPEAIMVSRITQNENLERSLYPRAFYGQGDYGPTQELVDAFPMANGYPIDHPNSGYDPSNPYENRDPRFYANIYYNGAIVNKMTGAPAMYTFDTTEGGQDAIGGTFTSPTGYYIKKFLYRGWNRNETYYQTSQRTVFIYRWSQMVLAFAEAANHVVGPEDKTRFGMSAKEALQYMRNRTTEDGTPGLGVKGDPYLDECCRDREKFDELVKNEWRLETCFEGRRFYDLRRWAKSADEVNVDLHGMKIKKNEDGSLEYVPIVAEERVFPSLWVPIPFDEIMMTDGSIVQNQGWESWK